MLQGLLDDTNLGLKVGLICQRVRANVGFGFEVPNHLVGFVCVVMEVGMEEEKPECRHSEFAGKL